MNENIRQQLRIDSSRLEALNSILLDPDMRVINDFLEVVAKYGTPEEINEKADQAGKLTTLLKKVELSKPEYLQDLEWLMTQRDNNAFITIQDYKEFWGKGQDILIAMRIARSPLRLAHANIFHG